MPLKPEYLLVDRATCISAFFLETASSDVSREVQCASLSDLIKALF